jgi:phenylalanyl-tRNA synthetase beta chain
MTEAGFNETMNYDLVDDATLYTKFGRGAESKLEVENPRSVEHYLLRDSLIPSLMAVLGRNTKNEYPQKVFEGGRTFSREGQGIREAFSVAALLADSSASFTEAKAHFEALVRRHLGKEAETRPASHWAFADGRTAQASVADKVVGHIGEVKPSVLAAFGVDVPVSGFELLLPTKRKGNPVHSI